MAPAMSSELWESTGRAPGWVADAFSGRRVTSGVRVNENTAMNYSACWAATRLLTETIATLPRKMYRLDERQKVPAVGHPTYRVFTIEPNRWQSAVTHLSQQFAFLINWGNAYAEITRDSQGRVTRLWPIHPNRIADIRRDDETQELVYYVRNNNGTATPIRQPDMFHVAGVLSENGVTGKGVIAHAAESIGMGIATEQFGGSLFGNGAGPAMVMTHPKTLTPEAADNLRRSWNKRYSGPDRGNGVLVLEEGTTVTPLTFPPEQAQFLQTRQFNITEIARWYNLPPHLLRELSKSSFCLPADVLVSTECGPKSIRDVKTGEMVWSLDLQGGWKLSRVSQSVCSGVDDILSISTTNRMLRANAKHRILVRRKHSAPRSGRGGYLSVEWKNEWIPAGELKVGDVLVTEAKLPDSGVRSCPSRENVSVGFMEFCGLLIGDGNIISNKSAKYITIARADKATYIEYYRNVLTAEFVKGGRVYDSGDNHNQSKLNARQRADIKRRSDSETFTSIAAEYGVDRGTIANVVYNRTYASAGKVVACDAVSTRDYYNSTRFSSKAAVDELTSIGFSGTARTKRVPSWVFQLCDELKLAFLRGYLDADGTVCKKGRVRFDSCSEPMLQQMRQLCMDVGIPVTNIQCSEQITTLPCGRKFPSTSYRFTCSDPRENLRIGSHTPEYVRRMTDGKPFERKDRNYPKYGGRGFDLPGCSLSRIRSIEKEPAEPVYDLEVEGTHSFVANGVVVHNSNIESESLHFVLISVLPWLVRWEEECNRQLLTEGDKGAYFFKFLLMGLLRGDMAARAAFYKQMHDMGVYSVNDILELEDRNPLGPEGDLRFVPLNMTTLDAAYKSTTEVQGVTTATTDQAEPSPDDTATTTTAVDAGAATDVQATALNGAQIASLMQLGTALATGTMPPAGTHAMIEASFPAMPRDLIDTIINDLDAFSKTRKPEQTSPVAPAAAVPAPAKAATLDASLAISQATLATAAQSVLTSTLAGLIGYEARQAIQAAKHPRTFEQWCSEFYGEKFAATFTAQVSPLLSGAVPLGVSVTPADFAAVHVATSRRELLSLLTTPINDFAAAVQTTVDGWDVRALTEAASAFTTTTKG